VWGPTYEIHWNSIWLTAQSHMTSHYRLRACEHSTWFWKGLEMGFGHLFWIPTIHVHNSWLVCEVVMSTMKDNSSTWESLLESFMLENVPFEMKWNCFWSPKSQKRLMRLLEVVRQGYVEKVDSLEWRSGIGCCKMKVWYSLGGLIGRKFPWDCLVLQQPKGLH
jgi:hypothetical protein